MDLGAQGFRVYAAQSSVANWAKAAHRVALRLTANPAIKAANLRHGDTWFVGVDALPNAPDGSIDSVPLMGPWDADLAFAGVWHRAQLSVVYPGYPRQDPDESEAAHRFRRVRHAAHVDGLLPEGPLRRRYLREWHGFILGLPLNVSDAAPLMVWPGSHVVMGQALRDAVGTHDPSTVDLTEPYQAARRAVFEQIDPVPVRALPGQGILLHRHLLHGVAAFEAGHTAPAEGRMIAYLRPQMQKGPQAWLAPDPQAPIPDETIDRD